MQSLWRKKVRAKADGSWAGVLLSVSLSSNQGVLVQNLDTVFGGELTGGHSLMNSKGKTHISIMFRPN